MGMKFAPTSFRPRNIGSHGIIAVVKSSNMSWFNQFIINHYTNKNSINHLINYFPKIEAIQIIEENGDITLITFEQMPNKTDYRINYFSSESNTANFSIFMVTKKSEATVQICNTSSHLDNFEFSQASSFIMGVLIYASYMHCDNSVKKLEIEPFEIFGRQIS